MNNSVAQPLRNGLVFLFCCLPAGWAAAQEPAGNDGEKNSKPTKQDTLSVRVYPLKFAAVDSVFPVVQKFFNAEVEGVRISSDVRLNALIANVNEDQHDMLVELLKTLDGPGENKESIRVFRLDNEVILTTRPLLGLIDNKVTVATADGMLLARGDQQSLTELGQLVELLDETFKRNNQVKSEAVRDVVVEIVWLTEKAIQDYPKFEGPISDSLAKRGFTEMREIGSLQVTTLVGTGRTIASGAAYAGRIEAAVTVSPGASGNHFEVEMELQADSDELPVRVSTIVGAKLDHWVVFGVAASASQDKDNTKPPRNVFLLRLKPQENIES